MVFIDKLGNWDKLISFVLKSSKNSIQSVCNVFGPIMAQDNASVAKFFVFSDPLNNILGAVILPVQRIHIPLYGIVIIFPDTGNY